MKKSKSHIILDYEGNILIGISMWHKINGKWVHIVQTFENDEITYFTNGKEDK